MGNLSQYFCEKNTLEQELSSLRNSNNTEEINAKEEEIQIVTRNAYLYGAGITIIAFIIVVNHAWGFFLAEKLGMKHRILFTAAIYDKAKNVFVCVHASINCIFIRIAIVTT